MNAKVSLGLLTALVVLVLDQASKLYLLFVYDIAARGAVRVAPFFDLTLTWNRGISYGWFQAETAAAQALLLAIKVAAIAALAIWLWHAHNRVTALGLGLIIGGAIGNGIDSVAYGAVMDFAFFHLQWGDSRFDWYVFNLADVAIVAGVIGLLYDSVLGPGAAKAP
ncbi:signal peptidase II [Bradyrhizobium sp. LHD-71]|uniref:signal peptidase II n=1 Tax=Bradyrhizobium sp. LHD-71 TaxID=3072141 RepID=UPI0028100DD4|nr:signal peptidase II [Bradyrhizobium sp. LHD-71]MDQ8726845.1 signal peptidase II [Bradyrhizobium sp. LHD-71]